MDLTIVKLAMTSPACPAEWRGVLADGRALHVRFRWGTLHASADGHELLHRQVSDALHGSMSTPKMLGLLAGAGVSSAL